MSQSTKGASGAKAVGGNAAGGSASSGLAALKRTRLSMAVIVTVLTVIVDQVTKYYARLHLDPHNEINVVGNFVRLTHAENSGAFLSIGSEMHAHTRFGIFTVLVVIFLLWATVTLYRKVATSNLGFLWGWTFLIAGGIGNVIDRIDKGTVTDFLIFAVGPLQTGVLNVADIAITGGILVVLFASSEGTTAPTNKGTPAHTPPPSTDVV